VLSAIDELNAQDPRQHKHAGRAWPYELIYSQWVTEWVHKLKAEPSEELQIAARGQHVKRWTSPRSSYPEVRRCLAAALRSWPAAGPCWRPRAPQVHALQLPTRPAASAAVPPSCRPAAARAEPR
jgi:hypothetical protein